ncbi:hypothetical protein JCM10213_007940 [Rhodosporidiobolus nylandii]
MSAENAQPCCVCGVETVNRCSACGAAGISLFFCSREHQKLVWKDAHSKVCGSTAVPLPQPALTAAEAEDMLHFADHKLTTRVDDLPADIAQFTDAIPSLAVLLKRRFAVERDKLPEFLDMLQQDKLPQEQRKGVLDICRIFLYPFVTDHEQNEQVKVPTPFQIYSAIVAAMALYCEPLGPPHLDLALLHHQFIVVAALFSHDLTLPRPPVYKRDFSKSAFRRVGILAVNTLKPDSMEKAQKLMYFLDEDVGSIVNLKLRVRVVPPSDFKVVAMTCVEADELASQ